MRIVKALQTAIPFLLILVVLSSCGEKLEKEVQSTFQNGEVESVAYFSNEGEERVKVKEERFYQNGQMEMFGHYKDGKRFGDWAYWYENGQKWTESGYDEEGLRSGFTIIWRESGVKTYEGSYTKGKPHGKWIFFDLDGTRLKEVLFENGKKMDEKNFKESKPFNPQVSDSVQFKVK